MTVVPTLQAVQDRIDITDTIYRYASCIDRFDNAGVRAVLADDIWAQYGNAEPMEGGDTVAKWIDEATADCIWQHHLLSVYHVDLDGDSAKALVYHTSYQMTRTNPDVVNMLVARYHNELTRTAGSWRISRLVFEILWGEQRTDVSGFLASTGGRGPSMDPSV
jgi:ketosteroid isomerase-like protein